MPKKRALLFLGFRLSFLNLVVSRLSLVCSLLADPNEENEIADILAFLKIGMFFFHLRFVSWPVIRFLDLRFVCWTGISSWCRVGGVRCTGGEVVAARRSVPIGGGGRSVRRSGSARAGDGGADR